MAFPQLSTEDECWLIACDTSRASPSAYSCAPGQPCVADYHPVRSPSIVHDHAAPEGLKRAGRVFMFQYLLRDNLE